MIGHSREPIILPSVLISNILTLTLSLLSDSLSHVTQGSAPNGHTLETPHWGGLDNENLEFSGYTLKYKISFEEKIGCIYFNSAEQCFVLTWMELSSKSCKVFKNSCLK